MATRQITKLYWIIRSKKTNSIWKEPFLDRKTVEKEFATLSPKYWEIQECSFKVEIEDTLGDSSGEFSKF